MLALDGVTLCCVDTTNHALALRALELSRRSICFARAMLLTDALPRGLRVPEGIEIVPVTGVVSVAAYSEFIIKFLLPHIATAHVLLVQWDGYVINPGAWTPTFLDCDYIGARWFWHSDGMQVGNGGFSMRSRRLLEALQDPRIVAGTAEDETISRKYRPLLENDYGIRFATEATADRFAFEAAYPVGRPFGFHGLYNFLRVVPADELIALAPTLSDAIACSPQLAQLLRNCAAMGKWGAAVAIAERILMAQPDNEEARKLAKRARTKAIQVPLVGRNEPCPCGSGRRFKRCHGTPNASGAADVPGA